MPRHRSRSENSSDVRGSQEGEVSVPDCCSVGERSEAPATMACPANGAQSKQVDMLTVRSLVRHLPLGMPKAQYYFCEITDCDVVYFASQPEAPIFKRADLLVRVGVKETEDPDPVCYCFGFTRKDIEEEVARTGRSAIAQKIMAEVKTGNCACEVKNPSGKCCLGNVTRVAQECNRSEKKARAGL